MIVFLSILWSVAVACLTGYLVMAARQITYVTLSDGRREERRLPLLFRFLLPLAPTATEFFRRPAFQNQRDKITRRLITSGYYDVLKPEEFLALRLLMPLVLGPCIVVFFALALALAQDAARVASALPRMWSLLAAALLWAFVYPPLWLNAVIALRHRLILRTLPFVIDLLTLSVEAGMDFMAAFKSVIDRIKNNPISEELARTLFEVQLGSTRRVALKALAERVNLSDLNTFIGALVQADEMGVSIGSTLRIQSDQIRQKRFMRAEKLANEAPVKMLLPLVVFIFPAVFLILLGPILLQMLRQGM